jgi:CheY-like chemotaxis protein
MNSIMRSNKIGCSLLYVEDDPDTRALLSWVIRRQFPDIELHVAENGRIGFDLFKEHSPNIVVTDINMPIMDGIQMSRLIKDINSEVTVIAVSGNISEDCRSDAFSAGINHYLNKPVMLQKFYMVIEDSINKTNH